MAVNLYCELSQGQPYSGALNVCFLGGTLEGNPNSVGICVTPTDAKFRARFGRAFQSHYVNPANGKERTASWGYDIGANYFFALTDDDDFPSQGWNALLGQGNISFGYNHAAVPGISFGVAGPNGGFGCPNYVRKDVLYVPRLALGANTRRVIDCDTAAPTTGNWDAGSIVFNAGAAASGKVGWVCVAGGAPGTWKAFGPIDA